VSDDLRVQRVLREFAVTGVVPTADDFALLVKSYLATEKAYAGARLIIEELEGKVRELELRLKALSN
jgi:hypothetical protein